MQVVIRYSPNVPDYAVYKARVNGRGLWRATLRPDTILTPSEWGGVIVFYLGAPPIPYGYLQLPSWTVLSTIPTVGQGEAVSRYSVGFADRSGLSLRLSPSDTNIIPHLAPNVKGFLKFLYEFFVNK